MQNRPKTDDIEYNEQPTISAILVYRFAVFCMAKTEMQPTGHFGGVISFVESSHVAWPAVA